MPVKNDNWIDLIIPGMAISSFQGANENDSSPISGIKLKEGNNVPNKPATIGPRNKTVTTVSYTHLTLPTKA